MADGSKIEWTDATLNPIRARVLPHADPLPRFPRPTPVGWHCEHVSAGCRNCYAERMNRRLGTGLDFKPGHRKNIEIFLDEKTLATPLRWKKPRRIFVCSMTDLFADFVKDEWIDRVFAVMALCPQHTFQILTKRPERMRDYMTLARAKCAGEPLGTYEMVVSAAMGNLGFGPYKFRETFPNGMPWPLPNVWLGVSCEDQETGDARIPHLLATPAAIRFLSCEPLLGEIDLASPYTLEMFQAKFKEDVERGIAHRATDIESTLFGLHWIICGGESGPNARPMHPDWARSLHNQCAAAGVAFFMKQMARKAPIPEDLFVREFPQ